MILCAIAHAPSEPAPRKGLVGVYGQPSSRWLREQRLVFEAARNMGSRVLQLGRDVDGHSGARGKAAPEG